MNSEKFWGLVDIREITECWEWQGGKSGDYGHCRIGLGVRATGAHRAAFEFFHGREPRGWVLHKCSNPGCMNPYHLYEGTGADNARDRAETGVLRGVRLRQEIRGRSCSGYGKYKPKPVIVPIVDGPEAWV